MPVAIGDTNLVLTHRKLAKGRAAIIGIGIAIRTAHLIERDTTLVEFQRTARRHLGQLCTAERHIARKGSKLIRPNSRRPEY